MLTAHYSHLSSDLNYREAHNVICQLNRILSVMIQNTQMVGNLDIIVHLTSSEEAHRTF